MAEAGVGPGAAEVVGHVEQIVHVLRGFFVIDQVDMRLRRADGRSQLVGLAGLLAQAGHHFTQLLHQRDVGLAVGGLVAQIRIGAAAARIFPVDVDAVEEFPGGQEFLDRIDEYLAVGGIAQPVERIGQGPAADGRQYLQIRIAFLGGHHLAQHAAQILGHARQIRLGHFAPDIMDGDTVVGQAGAGTLQRGLLGGRQAGVFAADRHEAVENVRQVVDRHHADVGFAAVNAPGREIGADHGVLGDGVLGVRDGIVRQVAGEFWNGVEDRHFVRGAAFAIALGVTDVDLHLLFAAGGRMGDRSRFALARRHGDHRTVVAYAVDHGVGLDRIGGVPDIEWQRHADDVIDLDRILVGFSVAEVAFQFNKTVRLYFDFIIGDDRRAGRGQRAGRRQRRGDQGRDFQQARRGEFLHSHFLIHFIKTGDFRIGLGP